MDVCFGPCCFFYLQICISSAAVIVLGCGGVQKARLCSCLLFSQAFVAPAGLFLGEGGRSHVGGGF